MRTKTKKTIKRVWIKPLLLAHYDRYENCTRIENYGAIPFQLRMTESFSIMINPGSAWAFETSADGSISSWPTPII